MKKLMILLGVCALGVAVQAATFNWKSSAAVYGVDVDSVTGNGTYTAGGKTARAMGNWSAVLALYTTGGDLVGTADISAIKWSTTGNKFNTSLIDIADAGQDTTYNYIVTITGSPASLTGKTSADYDYSAATMTAILKGEVTTATMGPTDLTTGVPAEWTVAGITSKTTPSTPSTDVPEPTSGLLLLLGMAGIALKRKRA